MTADLARTIRRMYADGYGIPTIARRLGVSVSTVRQALGRAG